MKSQENRFTPLWSLILGPLLLGLTAVQGCSSASRATAASDKSVSWSDMKAIDSERIQRSEYASNQNLYNAKITEDSLNLALNDEDDRISPEFKVPAPMRELVGFWLKIYTQYSTQELAIFDKKHPEIIYEVMDFRELSATARNRVVYEIVRQNRIKARIAAYRKAFSQLAKMKRANKNLNSQSPKLTEIQKIILTAHEKSDHKHTFAEWNGSLKTQTGQRDNVIKGLLIAETFIPKMEEIFKQLDLPPELTRIPLVESSFNVQAHSRAGAKGVWQFMPLSGKEYMRVSPELGIDERLSPLKSTVAAARLLKRNLVMTGNWPLAITAYNHGFTGIKRLTPTERNVHAIDGRLFGPCQKKRHLGYASSNYYAEFLAMVHAEVYKDVFYGDSPLPIAPPLKFHKITKSQTAAEYARSHGLSIHDFKLFNPDIRNLKMKLPVGLYVAIPGHEAEMDELIAAIRVKPIRRIRADKNKQVTMLDQTSTDRRR